ncbi:MAG: DUF4065 domain-containing protein [Chloroflexota bacterium]|nr:DUF4065 domain-containing protein [Chloroflexota bacterium]
MPVTATSVATASDVARYFLGLATDDGDLITNLKMQKLVYYAYAWTLVRNGQKLFDEPIQAWANGPVIPSLYQELKGYRAGPIGEEFLGVDPEVDPENGVNFDAIAAKFPEDVLETLNGVYEQYMRMSAFDLVIKTHSERPWREARQGLGVTERGEVPIADEDIIKEFSAA